MSHPEATRQDKARQIWKIKINEEKNYRIDEAFGYKLFVTITHPSIFEITLVASHMILLIFSNNF
jgi:hypothetical protein